MDDDDLSGSGMDDDGLSAGAIAGIVIGSLVGVLGIVALCIIVGCILKAVCCKWNKQQLILNYTIIPQETLYSGLLIY